MNPIRLYALTLGALAVLATVFSPADALNISAIKNTELRSCLLDIRFVKLSGDAAKTPGETGSYFLPDEDPLHADGIYSMSLVQCSDVSPLGEGIACNGFSEVTLFKPRHGLAKLDCGRIAMSYAHDHFARLFRPGLLTASTVANRRPDLTTGVWTFSWYHPGPSHDEGLHTAEVSVDVRSLDGKVVGFQAYRALIYPSHRITSEAARSIALNLARKEHGDFTPLISSVALNDAPASKPDWIVDVVGYDRKNDIHMRRTISLDSQTGRELDSVDTNHWVAAQFVTPDMIPVAAEPEDRMPVWTREGLAFLSTRQLTDLPGWAPHNMQAMMLDGTGGLTYITAALNSDNPEKIDGQAQHSALNIQIKGRVYSIDLGSGKILKTPTLNKSPDQQIEGGNFLVGSKRWAYFISKRRAGQSPGQTLFRVRVGPINAGDDPDGRRPQIVVALMPADVTRISQFGSTDRLLIQAKSGMFTIDGDTKKMEELTLPTLTDESSGAPISNTTDGYAGPTNSTILFAGESSDGGSKVRWRIYQCALDGTSLKALTPASGTPVTCHRFGQGSADAYDVTLTLLATAVSKDPDLSPDSPMALPVQ